MNKSIVIVGSGALGCLFACKLASAGYEPVMLADWQPAMEAISAHGVRAILENGREVCEKIQVETDPRKINRTDLALVLVKSWQTGASAEQLKILLSKEGVAYTLQNGLGNLEILASELGSSHTAAGICTIGAQVISPGFIKQSGSGKVTLGNFKKAEILKEMLINADVPVSIEENITGLLWQKAIANAAINPLTAILSTPNGRLLGNPWGMEMIRKIVGEAEEIASLAGVELPEKDMLAYIIGILKSTRGNLSSMLQDLRNGRETEIDAINGMLVKIGADLGYTAYFNHALTLVIKSLVNNQKNRGT